MVQKKATNITWHEGKVTPENRAKVIGHHGAVLWFTGLSGSGKSTLADAMDALLNERGHHSYVLDGDNVRHGLNKDLGFSPDDRHENIRRIGEVAALFENAGIIVMTAFISPYMSDRNIAREHNPSGRFIEVHCNCSLSVCEERDPKGLYKKARAGEIKEFTGIDAPYEAPPHAEITVNTDSETVEESAAKVLEYLEAHQIIPPAD